MTFKEIFGEEIAEKVEAIAKENGINIILDSVDNPEYIQKDQALSQVTELNQEWEGKYKNTIMESAIKLAAVNLKAKDPGDMIVYVDKTKLKINSDGSIEGLNEQLESLTKSKAYLFEETQPLVTGGCNPVRNEHTSEKTFAEAIKDYLL